MNTKKRQGPLAAARETAEKIKKRCSPQEIAELHDKLSVLIVSLTRYEG